MGLYDESNLVAVAAFKVRPLGGSIVDCFCSVLAVQDGFRRRGCGLELKAAVISVAKRANAFAVISCVASMNVAMLELNRRLGARSEPHPSEDGFPTCIVPT